VHIPRLEDIAMMICRQHDDFSADVDESAVALGAQILKVSLAFDERIARGDTPQAAASVLMAKGREYNPRIVNALAGISFDTMAPHPVVVPIGRLEAGMIIDEDISTKTGLLLVARGQEITYPMLMRLRNFHHHAAIGDQVRVLVLRPAFETDPAARVDIKTAS
jgi:hypothetical protein